MVLEALLLAGKLLSSDAGLAAKAETKEPVRVIIETDEQKRTIENATSMYNSGCEIYKFHGANDTATHCIMTAFAWYTKVKTPTRAWKEKAVEVILKNSESVKKRDPLLAVSNLITLCSYGLKGCKDGWVAAETLSRDHPDPEERKNYGRLARELRSSYKVK